MSFAFTSFWKSTNPSGESCRTGVNGASLSPLAAPLLRKPGTSLPGTKASSASSKRSLPRACE